MNKLLVLLLLVTSVTIGQNKEHKDVNVDDFMVDTQYTKDGADDFVMIWWMPFEFWSISSAQDPDSSEEEIAILEEMLEGYELFAITKGKIGYFGGITYEPIETLRGKFSVNYRGESLELVDKKDVNADLASFVSMISPMMSNMLGQMGENMHFVFMKENSKSQVLPISTTEKVDLILTLDDYVKKVDLPLNSMVMEKMCPEDEDLLSGKWNYCPLHGDALKNQ